VPVILDTTMLTLFLRPHAPAPNDPKTNAPVLRAAERVELLIEQLAKDGNRILLPAPVWAELLVAAGDSGPSFAAEVNKRFSFEIVAFDAISAVEAAVDQRNALKAGNKKIQFDGSRQCVKADRQIMAIGKTRNVDAVYTADTDFVKIGGTMNVNVITLWDLPLPSEELSRTPLFDGADEAASTEAVDRSSEDSNDPEKA
jgi:predicted nucleic acid-binding protein